MPKREIDVLENYKAYKELKRVRAIEEAKQFEATTIKKKNFLNEYYKTLENREQKERYHGKLLKEAKDYYFGAALKGIYIGALEAATLTDDALYLAENMVDSYITEKGGYNNIISNVKSDTYLLAKIRRLVEDAAEEEVKQLEDDEKELEAEPDVEVEEAPEDEKDSAEVAPDTQLTTANITDIVNALNKAGLEVVNKGQDADNFKDSQPETPDTKPDMEFEDKPAEETPATDEAPAEPDNAEATTSETEDDVNELDKDLATADSQPTGDTTEAPATDDAATEATPADTQEETSTEDSEAATDEENELDKDLEIADDNNEKEAEETDDNLDPDSVNVYDDGDEEDGDDVDFGDEDEELEDSGEDLGDEDIDDVNDEELGDESDDLGDEDEEDSEEEESEEVEDIDIDGDGEEDLGDVDEPEGTVNVDPHKTMMDELENEKEVQDAIELIRTRVADAEEAFIKRNQEDKKKMDDILSKISQNVATVEKIAKNDSDKAEDAKAGLEESTRMFRQKIRELDDRPMSIFNRMTKNISESIIRDPKKANMFINESTGQADFSLLVETSKVMYGFLETLNTLQLESVNSDYITNIINGIN